jgi:NADH:ubiquinone oxidoreductase subunit F (NADH-binding)
VPLGIRLADLLGPVPGPVLAGGYFGAWLTPTEVAATRLCRGDLAVHGASVGAGVLSVLDDSICGLAESARVGRWLAGQTAGQCGPCVFGLAAIAGALDRLVAGDRDHAAEAALHRWLGMVAGRGACKHPDGAARFIGSALRVFASEVEHHRRHGPCGRGVGVLPTPAGIGWR